MLNLSVTCNTSSNVQVIKECSSCLYNFPCDCTLRTSNLTFSTHRHPCENTPSTKPALVGFTVNLGVLQLINMSLAQLIDPGLLFGRPLGLTSSEHSGRLLGISSNYVIRQAEIFKHARKLGKPTLTSAAHLTPPPQPTGRTGGGRGRSPPLSRQPRRLPSGPELIMTRRT